ncbi:hypothetical protein MYVALT_G_00430 [Candidatus Vallotia tarda]|uniref:Uncharacterized protein n=1 Tax=Candidatus Vallotiella hemipterorum TaxID=1177213 RepID=A0A916NE42_9BURK|nr:hypothetical protein MYVALT_G_00430 [Candidatus Vallotia tarda]
MISVVPVDTMVVKSQSAECMYSYMQPPLQYEIYTIKAAFGHDFGKGTLPIRSSADSLGQLGCRSYHIVRSTSPNKVKIATY